MSHYQRCWQICFRVFGPSVKYTDLLACKIMCEENCYLKCKRWENRRFKFASTGSNMFPRVSTYYYHLCGARVFTSRIIILFKITLVVCKVSGNDGICCACGTGCSASVSGKCSFYPKRGLLKCSATPPRSQIIAALLAWHSQCIVFPSRRLPHSCGTVLYVSTGWPLVHGKNPESWANKWFRGEAFLDKGAIILPLSIKRNMCRSNLYRWCKYMCPDGEEAICTLHRVVYLCTSWDQCFTVKSWDSLKCLISPEELMRPHTQLQSKRKCNTQFCFMLGHNFHLLHYISLQGISKCAIGKKNELR